LPSSATDEMILVGTKNNLCRHDLAPQVPQPPHRQARKYGALQRPHRQGGVDRVGGLAALLNVFFVVPIVSIEKPDAFVALRYS